MKTIIVPLDGSALAEQVLPYVRRYASLFGAEVLLLRVVTDEEQQQYWFWHASSLEGVGLNLPHPERQSEGSMVLVERARSYLDAHAAALRAAGLWVTTAVDTGAPAEAIGSVAGEHPGALIMLATHGYSGLRRWAFGSTADRVVHTVEAPVFLVRSRTAVQEPPAPRRILVPLDGSPLAEQALPCAAEIAARAGATLTLVQAVLPFTELAPAFTPLGRPVPIPSAHIDQERERVREELQRLGERLSRPGLAVTTVTELGYPAEVILTEADRQEADLIVMATHGRDGLERWVLGSVAEKVLHASHTPLLLVRPRAA